MTSAPNFLPDAATSFSCALQISNAAQMQSLGREIGQRLKTGDVLWLSGELGAGKTTLTQGIAQGLEIAENITSPTFVLMTEYHSGSLPLLHLDAYRLENLNTDDLREAGLDDFFARSDAIRVVEWPSVICKYLQMWPPAQWTIDIEHQNDARRVHIKRL